MELVQIPKTRCPRCHSPVTAAVWTQEALFQDNGFGAAAKTTRVFCGHCGWALVRSVESKRPTRTTKGD